MPARVVNRESILLGEYAENELRKDFTKAERYAIAKQIKALLGERRGRLSEKNVENSPHFETGTKTRDIAKLYQQEQRDVSG